MNGILLDLRATLRAWRSTPAPVIAALVTIALGTGINTAVFAVAYGILLRPLPYPDSNRLVVMSVTGPDGSDFGVRITEVDEWRDRLRSVEELAAYTTGESIVRGGGEPQSVRTAFVTGRFFRVMDLAPVEGYVGGFSDTAGQAIVSRRLATDILVVSNQPVLGRALTVGDTIYSVAAILPDAFTFPSEDALAWIPASTANAVRAAGLTDSRSFRIIARLKKGVSVEQARDDADRVIRETRGADPAKRGGGRATVTTIQDIEVGRVRPVLEALSVGAILVLLVACANVATLLVGRAIGRSREMAVRLALGAPATRLARSAVTESAVLALVGSLMGLTLGVVAFRLFVRAAAGVLPRLATATIDLPVLAANVGVAILVTILCGAAPALKAVTTRFSGSFNSRESTASPAVRKMRTGLTIAQLALSIVLLIGAGLLTRTVTRLLHEDAGIQPNGVLTVRLMMSNNPRFDASDRAPFVRALLERVRALPGVTAAGIGSSLPPRMSQISMGINVRTEKGEGFQIYSLTAVTPGYLEAIGARLVNGRLLSLADETASQPVLVISRAAVKHMFLDRDPIGREFPARVPPRPQPGPKPRVIGVVENVKYRGLDAPAGAGLYVAWSDFPASVSYLIVRTTGDPMALAPAVRRAIRDLDPAMPIPAMSSLEDEMLKAVADRRLRAFPAAAFGVLALAVAFVGVFGTIARSVAERRREIAVRMAMGASPRRTWLMVVRQAAGLTVIAVAIGLGTAALAARGLASLLYGVSPYDEVTFTAVALIVTVTSLLACAIPARRASRVQPVELLRTE